MPRLRNPEIVIDSYYIALPTQDCNSEGQMSNGLRVRRGTMIRLATERDSMEIAVFKVFHRHNEAGFRIRTDHIRPGFQNGHIHYFCISARSLELFIHDLVRDHEYRIVRMSRILVNEVRGVPDIWQPINVIPHI